MTATLERPGAPLRLNAPTLGQALGPLGRRPRDLTPRERAALTLLAEGHKADEAARRLGIAPATLKHRLGRVFDALGAANAAHAVALGHLRGDLYAQPVDARTSRRRMQVLVLVARGLTNDEIGRELWLSASTAKSHVSGLLVDLGAGNRPHLVHRGFGCGALGVARRGGGPS